MRESFNDLTYKELLTKREDIKKKYRDLKYKVVVGHVDNHLEKRVLRRKIARLNTIIHEYDLGIRKQ